MDIRFLIFIVIVTAIILAKSHAEDASAGEKEALEIGLQLDNLTQQAYDVVNKNKTDNPLYFPGIETWKAPEKIRKGCPWYVMGRDYEERLIFVWEVGRCNYIPFVVEGTDQDAEDVEKHVTQLLWRIGQTGKNSDEETAMLIMDAQGYNATQLRYFNVIKQKLTYCTNVEYVERYIANPVIINLTFASQLFIRLVERLAGHFAGRLEKISRREKWEPYLKKHIPVDQLPPFYGGNEKYKPLEA